MVFNNSNRLFIGLLIVLTVFFSYLFSYDYYLLFLILFLITYDLYKININNIYLFTLLIVCIVLSIIPIYQIFKYFFCIELLLIIFILINKNYIKYYFVFLIYVFYLLLFYINHVDRDLLYIIIFVSFFNDTIAYLVGKNLGGPLIIPNISPKKTWSGTLISFMFSSLLLYFLKFNIFLSIIMAISLFLGDVFFSFIKRHLNIKDFSMSFGDHGGVLDRLDSMFFVAIILQTYLVIFT